MAVQLGAIVAGMFDFRKENAAFNNHLRDSLVQTKEFATSDNAELYAERFQAVEPPPGVPPASAEEWCESAPQAGVLFCGRLGVPSARVRLGSRHCGVRRPAQPPQPLLLQVAAPPGASCRAKRTVGSWVTIPLQSTQYPNDSVSTYDGSTVAYVPHMIVQYRTPRTSRN